MVRQRKLIHIFRLKNYLVSVFFHLRITHKILLLLIISFFCSSCTSISRGITEGVLKSQNQDREDVRECNIRGSKFEGLQTVLDRQKENASLKVLMVHGIGEHSQGYSTRMSENLASALNLNVVNARFKEITIITERYPDEDLGKLRIQRYANEDDTKEMLFYELTWSPISAKEKEIIAFDDSGEHSFRRASINNTMKGFMNSHVSDPLIYLGAAQNKIQLSVITSLCWMMSRDWEDLGGHTQERCISKNPDYDTLLDDEYAFISHSMGSRIVTDSLQALVQYIAEEMQADPDEDLQYFVEFMKNKQIPVYMLANQLPLLQLGREIPEVTNQFDDYCIADGKNYDNRFFKELTVIAFSDPNDIVSYDVPPRFVDEFMDSRLCVNMINVTINVANVVELFGLGSFANPGIAHREYDNDERVVGIISHGLNDHATADIIKERCNYLETR